MKNYQGAVLFIDMLGFGELTRGRLKLTTNEYKPWNVDVESIAPHQLLAAKLLIAFRKALISTQNAYKSVQIAQLSDCCFFWSRDLGGVVDAGRHFMRQATLGGLLCRGGFACGRIHEPPKGKQSLGAFIVGDAVTRAATLERSGKGARMFTDQETGNEVLKMRPDERFQPLTNPLTGESVDEWLWYAPQASLRNGRNTRASKAICDAIKTLVSYHTTLRYSPRLAWSATTPEGRRQIACTIAAVSQELEKASGNSGNYGFSVEILLNADTVRSETTQKKLHDKFVRELTRIVKRSAQASHNPEQEFAFE